MGVHALIPLPHQFAGEGGNRHRERSVAVHCVTIGVSGFWIARGSLSFRNDDVVCFGILLVMDKLGILNSGERCCVSLSLPPTHVYIHCYGLFDLGPQPILSHQKRLLIVRIPQLNITGCEALMS